VLSLLSAAGVDAETHPSRGLDHGAWLALELLFPGAPLPIVPVSMPEGLAAALRLGAALAPLRADGVAIVCSGSATHSQDFFRESFFGATPKVGMGGDEASVRARRAAVANAEANVAKKAPWSVAFDRWLAGVLTAPGVAPSARAAKLQEFHTAPGAAKSHPEPSHFLPVLVFAGTDEEADGSSRSSGTADADTDTDTDDADGGGGGGGVSQIATGFQHGLSMAAYRLGDGGVGVRRPRPPKPRAGGPAAPSSDPLAKAAEAPAGGGSSSETASECSQPAVADKTATAAT
jgi:hypothetical protein